MVRPFLRDNSCVFYFRKAIPADLRKIVGRSVIKFTLGTTDPAVAEAMVAEHHRHWEENFASLRAGHVELTHIQRVAMAGVLYREYVDRHYDEPGQTLEVHMRILYDGVTARSRDVKIITGGKKEIIARLMAKLMDRHRKTLEAFLVNEGLVLAPIEFDQVLGHVNNAMYKASIRIKRFHDGDYGKDPADSSWPEYRRPTPIGTDGKPQVQKEYDILEIYKNYSAQQGHAESTLAKYRAILVKVAEAHRDIRDIDRAWCNRWRASLLATGLSTATVKKAYLSVLTTVCAEAVNLGLISANPASDLKLAVRSPVKLRASPDYSDAEAAIVLSATLGSHSDALPPDRRRARRWLPWLSCYSGARIGELTQIRAEDVIQVAGYWFYEITPLAGPVKARKPRRVPIHPHVLQQGFIDMVREVGEGYLFLDLSRLSSNSAKVGRQTAEHIGEWVRSLGVIDPELQPTHGWRHRLATLRRGSGMTKEMAFHIMGHTPQSEGDKYGGWRPIDLGRGIELIPWTHPTSGMPAKDGDWENEQRLLELRM